jgi:chaperone modulatory protein CbpM
MNLSQEALFRLVAGLDAAELEYWIEQRWVLPEGERGAYCFHDIDVARIRLILDIRRDLAIDDETMPLILSLMDQVYGLRHRLIGLSRALAAQPREIREAIAGALSEEEVE